MESVKMRLGTLAWLSLGLCLCFNFWTLALAANILGVFPYRLPSHFQVARPFMKALSERGHRITMITPVGMLEDIPGVRHIRVPRLNSVFDEIFEWKKFIDLFNTKWGEAFFSATMLYNISTAVLNDSGVQKIIQDRSERFDMIVMEAGHLDALLGLAEFYNASLVGLSCLIHTWNVDYLAGNPSPSVYEPILPRGYHFGSSLTSKWMNLIHITEEKLLDSLILRPPQLRIFQKYFGYSPEKLSQLRSKFSLILINNHFSMGRVRANVPNIIEVGGLHLSEPHELCDGDLQRFLDEAEHGVIYFSLGMDVLVKYLPDTVQHVLMDSFSQLKQRVVWKSDLEVVLYSMDNSSIYSMSKTPQRAILEHPNVRLFITHGGLLSVMESVYSGVPMLGLPLFFDQFGHLHRVEQAGMAKVLDPNSVTTDLLTSTILELMQNTQYSKKAKEMSQSFRDRPSSPLATAIWWTEYALRHPDTRHMRLDEDENPLMRYYGLDSLISWGLRFGFVLGTIIVLTFLLYRKYSQKIKLPPKKKTIIFHIVETKERKSIGNKLW